MARARSPNSIEAEEMYKRGMKLVDIAKKLDVPASTVRRWKSTQNWDGDAKKKKNERSQKKKTNARHKGGQPGNKNAVGNKGGPLKPGDKIAEKHDICCTLRLLPYATYNMTFPFSPSSR